MQTRYRIRPTGAQSLFDVLNEPANRYVHCHRCHRRIDTKREEYIQTDTLLDWDRGEYEVEFCCAGEPAVDPIRLSACWNRARWLRAAAFNLAAVADMEPISG